MQDAHLPLAAVEHGHVEPAKAEAVALDDARVTEAGHAEPEHGQGYRCCFPHIFIMPDEPRATVRSPRDVRRGAVNLGYGGAGETARWTA
ncbi:hypothetical protein Misp01_40990 [Microtetraspora sp. NBRC 13810]|nr:hypothetical protein Misp01_40990 [Microtetraspora sp. NBRC 13810]